MCVLRDDHYSMVHLLVYYTVNEFLADHVPLVYNISFGDL